MVKTGGLMRLDKDIEEQIDQVIKETKNNLGIEIKKIEALRILIKRREKKREDERFIW